MYVPGEALDAAVTVIVDAAEESVAGVTLDGLNVIVTPGIDDDALSATGELKPLFGVIVIVELAEEPWLTLVEAGLADRAKSGDWEGDVL